VLTISFLSIGSPRPNTIQASIYDMDKDRTELNDVSAAMPDRVREMLVMYLDWAQRCNVFDAKELRKL
jgi:hypothetical protein